MSVSNGSLSSFVPGEFIITADPRIDAIGQFDKANGRLDPNDDQLIFNAGEYLAIRGAGLYPSTKVMINGKTVLDLEVEDSRMLSFRVPDNTVGNLNITISNQDNNEDEVESNELEIYLEASKRLSYGNQIARCKDLLLITKSKKPPLVGNKAQLMTTRDGVYPVVLSEMNFDIPIKQSALSEKYALFWTESDVLISYDISNVYAPEKINQISNPDSIEHNSLTLSKGTFISRASNGDINIGNVHGSGWTTLQNDSQNRFLDIAVDDSYLYILREYSVDIRSLDNINSSALSGTSYHNLITPEALATSAQRVVIYGGNQIEIMLTGRIKSMGLLEKLGSVNTSGEIDAAVTSGDLLALASSSGSNHELALFDINKGELPLELNLDKIVSIAGNYNLQNNKFFNFDHDLLEWCSGGYFNLRIPLLNTTGVIPVRTIPESHETIALKISGAAIGWDKVVLDVIDTNGHVLSGDCSLVGKELSFYPIGDAYTQAETYKINLFNNPLEVIDGGNLNIDIPWYLDSAPIFGLVPMEIQKFEPSFAITGRETTFTVSGAGFDAMDSLRLNNTEIPLSQIIVSENGTKISFTATIDQPGMYTLTVEQQNVQLDTMPVALVVSEAVSITNVTTDNDRGNNYVSVSG